MASGLVRRDTSNGPVEGFIDTFSVSDHSTASAVEAGQRGPLPAVQKWLGIPFAQAERWVRPTAPSSWKEPLKCFEFGPYFPQPPDVGALVLFAPEGVPMRRNWSTVDEANAFCLNVFAPEDTKPGEKLPVLAWIHGGGLVTGLSSDWAYDPTSFIRREAAAGRRVIVVTGNHRLNVLGFLASKDLAEVDPDGLAGNYGLYDCVAYLEWIRKNISNFGGDPDNVLLYGESAGSFLVSTLLVHPTRLCRRAIVQSGGASLLPTQTLDYANKYYEHILSACGITSQSHQTAEERVTALRKVPWGKLADATNALPGYPWTFVLESGPKAIWTEHTETLVKTGRLNPAIDAVMFGVMKEEGNLFVQTLAMLGLKGWAGLEKLFTVFPPPIYMQIKEFYGIKDNDESTKDVDVAQILGTGFFYASAEHYANTIATTGLPVYAFQIESSIERLNKRAQLGPTHSVSLPLLFNGDDLWSRDTSTVEARSSAAIGQMLTEFAATGKVSLDLPLWKDNKGILRFTANGRTEKGAYRPLDREREFWLGVIEQGIAASSK